MEQIKVTDELLKKVLPKVCDELVNEWENSAIEDHTFSKSFNRKMSSLIWKHKNKQLFKELKIVGKIVVAACLIICICLFSNKMVARANLDILFKKIEVALEDSSMYVYDEKNDMYYYTLYEPGYVPKEYEEVSSIIDDNMVFIKYTNKNGDKIYWKQTIVKNGLIVGADEEYDEVVQKEYAGDNVKIYIYETGRKRIYYEIGSFIFTINATDISMNEIYKIIKEMKEIEK